MGHTACIHVTHPDHALSVDEAFVRDVNTLLGINLEARNPSEYFYKGDTFDVLVASSEYLEIETPERDDVMFAVYEYLDEERVRTAVRLARKLESAGYRVRAEDGLLGDIDL